MVKIIKSDSDKLNFPFINIRMYLFFLTLGLGLMAVTESVYSADKKSAELYPGAKIHAGKILSVTTTVSSVPWLNLEDLMLAGNLNSGDQKGTAETERKPEADKLFVILEVQLTSDRSIGKYDYILQIQNKSVECEGLAIGDKPFDPRKWQIDAENVSQSVKLLYEVPRFDSETTAVLTPNLDTIVRLKSLELSLQPPPTTKKEE